MPRISFLLPTYDRMSFIAESIDAIRAQMHDDDELLVIDDGSTDGTAAVVAGFGSAVRYVRQDNAGKSVALNRGMAMTSGDFVMICDDDDILRSGSVAPLAEALSATGAGFAFGRYSRFRDDPDGKRVDLGTGYWPDLSQGSLVRHVLEDAFVMQNAALVRRSAYEQVGPFDEAMLRSLDYEMFVRLALAVSATFVDRYIFDQRKHEGARGPAKALHAAATSDRVWQEYDRRIFMRVHDRLPIEGYAAMFESADDRRVHRAALLQRACVNARHDLWELAIGDLEAAAAIVPGLPLSGGEAAICGRVLNGKHGFPGALQPDMLDRLERLLEAGAAGRDIVRQMLSGAMWRLRDESRKDARSMRSLSRRLLGISGTVAMLAGRKLSGSNPGTDEELLVERLHPDITIAASR